MKLDFFYFKPVLSKEVMYINVPGFPSAKILPFFLHIYCTMIIMENVFRLMSYPCDPVNKKIQRLYVRQSLTPNTFSLVELLCLVSA